MSTVYVNVSERYGDQVLTEVSDYREINPDGQFVETTRNGRAVIIERDYDSKGRDEIVAEARTDSDE